MSQIIINNKFSINHFVQLIGIILSVNSTSGIAGDQNDYARAKDALKKNDCVSAIKYLERYKQDNELEIKKTPELSSQIDKQISICKDHIASSGGGVKINGVVNPDSDTKPQKSIKSIQMRDF